MSIKKAKWLWCIAGLLALPAWAIDVVITEPAADRAYQRPAQNIEIMAQASSSDHLLAIYFDDDLVAYNQNSATLDSMNYKPGEHIITAELQDDSGRVIASSSRRVYIIQNTAIIRQKRAQAAAKAAYDALPWYKKLFANFAK